MMVVACQASCVMAPFRHKLNRLFTRNTLLLFSDMLLHCGTLTKVKEPGLEVSRNNFEINKHNCHNSVNYFSKRELWQSDNLFIVKMTCIISLHIETNIEAKNCLILGSSHILSVICWSMYLAVPLQQIKSELSSHFWMSVCLTVGFWNFKCLQCTQFP